MDTITRTNTLTMSAAVLSDLLTGALVAAGKDKSLPTLCAVLLEHKGEHLSATATDRFRLITGSTNTGAGGEWSALVGREGAALILALVKALPKRKGKLSPRWEISLKIDTSALVVTLGTDTLTLDLEGGSFPPYEHLLESASAPVTLACFNPLLIGDFSKVPASKQPRYGSVSPMVLTFTGEGEAVKVSINHDLIVWRGLVMPMRLPS